MTKRWERRILGPLYRFRKSFFAACVACFAMMHAAVAQPIQFGVSRSSSVQLSPARVNTISGSIATRLEQARALAKDRNWDDAIDILRELAAERSDGMVELSDGRYVSLRAACH